MKRLVVLAGLAACGKVGAKTPDASVVDSKPIDSPAIDAPTCVTSPASLRARWRAESNTNEDTGVYNGTAVGALAYTPGKHGMAFSFDGTDAAVTADPSDQLYPPGSFTLELWVKTAAAPANDVALIQKYDCGGADGCGGSLWDLVLTQGGSAQFDLRVTGGAAATITATTGPITNNAWHYVVGVRDVTAMKELLYVDGALAVSAPLSAAFLGALTNADGFPDVVTIGAMRTAGSNALTFGFAGAIDEAAYYIDALSAAEIAAIYAAPQGICH